MLTKLKSPLLRFMSRFMSRYMLRPALLLLVLAPACAQRTTAGMEITTKSPQARALFKNGLAKMETLHLDDGLQSWRKATQRDPDFALAHIFLAYFAQDPTEQVAEREKALAARPRAGKEEQLIIDWLANASQARWVPAIQSMNEALSSYPRDKHLAWLAGWWLLLAQDAPERAIPMFRRAILIDPNFADPWNEAAYCYARTGNFAEAFRHIKRYSELLPSEPNPQDSYAEISRMAGRFDSALAHYRRSLKIDPKFVESQLGLGDTYALMGKERRARAEYAIAIQKGTKVQAVLWSLQSATSYLREGDFAGADTAFVAAAHLAHDNDFENLEAEAYRDMSFYSKDSSAALDALRKAEAVLREKKNIPQALLDQERASVLRARAERAAGDGNMKLAATTIRQLEQMVGSSSDQYIQIAYHGAAGAVLVAQGKYDDAIAHLEEDDRNPLSMQGLAVAYEKTGASEKAQRMTARLLHLNEPTIEQAVVVPAFRKTHAAGK